MRTLSTILVLFFALVALVGSIVAMFVCPLAGLFLLPCLAWTGHETGELIGLIWK